MDEAIQLAISLCPLVLIDIVDATTIRFDFQASGIAREFADELIARNLSFQIVRLGREVIIRSA